MSNYQLMLPLSTEEYGALRADIQVRGIQVPVEFDEDGNVLDGHHRVLIANELGLTDFPKVVRRGMTEQQKQEHVLKLNIARRHLDPLRWGAAFKALLELRGVRTGQGAQKEETATVAVLAGELAVSERTARYRKRLHDDYEALPDEYQSIVDEGGMTVTAAKRAHLREQNRQQAEKVVPSNPEQPAQCIVIDPPWDVADEGDVEQMGRANPLYATMPLDSIRRHVAERLEAVAAPNCHLYLWITNRSLPKGFGLFEDWGFRYVTVLTWCKPSIGIGNYFRNNTEHVLFGVRGSLPLLYQDTGTWFEAARGSRGHSSKPESFYAMVRRVSPGPHHEMFARHAREGFSVEGAEAA